MTLPKYVTCPECKRAVEPTMPSTICGPTCNTCGHMLPRDPYIFDSFLVEPTVWWKPEMGGEIEEKDSSTVMCGTCFKDVYEAVKMFSEGKDVVRCIKCFKNDI